MCAKELTRRRLVDRALDAYGRLDGAFNNAGIVGEMGAFAEMSAANWEAVISTNLTSAFFALKAQLPVMKAQRSGSIVFTSSFVGYSNGGLPGMGAYAASKAGLIGLVTIGRRRLRGRWHQDQQPVAGWNHHAGGRRE